MELSGLGATSALVILAVLLIFAVPRMLNRKALTTIISAERYAHDVCLEEQLPESSKTAAPAPRHSSPYTPTYTLRYGRIIIFMMALAFFLFSVGEAIFALMGAKTWPIAGISFLGALSCISTLRFLALRDAKKRRKQQLSSSSMNASSIILKKKNPPVSSPVERRSATSEGPTSSPSSRRTKPVPRQNQKPSVYAAKSLRYLRTHDTSKRPQLEGTARGAFTDKEKLDPPFELAVSSWEPTPTPIPTYLKVPVVERQQPEPLKKPSYPRSQTQTLIQAQRLRGATETLDEILKRRRA
ncbi:hypothetical protein ACN08X_00645 [Rothia sp. P6271]|uniref:hypothetical protein n=1 Tax=Rothia sp. P6271 TaxID=3402659 RepID=UPI003ACDA365